MHVFSKIRRQNLYFLVYTPNIGQAIPYHDYKQPQQKDLNEFFVDKAHLALNDGEMFGKEGIGFMRLNVASPRCIIEKAMKQLADAYQLYIK